MNNTTGHRSGGHLDRIPATPTAASIMAVPRIFEFSCFSDARMVALGVCPEHLWSDKERAETLYSFLDTADGALEEHDLVLFVESARVLWNSGPRHQLHVRAHTGQYPSSRISCELPPVFARLPWSTAAPEELCSLVSNDQQLLPAVVEALPIVGPAVSVDVPLCLSGRMKLWTIAHTFTHPSGPASRCTIELTKMAKLDFRDEIETMAPHTALVVGAAGESSEAIAEVCYRIRSRLSALGIHCYSDDDFGGYDGGYLTWWKADTLGDAESGAADSSDDNEP